MFKPITIKDIAVALNLSASTVSRALSDSYEINQDTKKRVLEYAEKNNYKRNPIALSLKQRKSYSIGIIVCEVANSFFSQAIDGIESVAYKKGYNIIISQSHDSYEREVINIEHLANRSVDGLLISLSAETKDFEHLKKLHAGGLPIVFFDRIYDGIETHKVASNNKKGAKMATQHLINKGYRKIAHLANAPHLSITKERLAGYQEALAENGFRLDQKNISYCHHGGSNQKEVETAVQYFLSMNEKPDAIFVASDRLSIGCLTALKKLSDNDYNPAIAGFSNSDVLDLFQSDFSSIRQPAFEMGRAATDLLIQLIESKYPIYEHQSVVLDTELIERVKGKSK
ncbi:LacI family DNA-binding transcriptional regulator [Olivibacter sp. SDN3]|uniref:LacI family DNA-binding transcriptional regulator n=1 Tax=Olivibacter sp. SDN3 TaxID=2764720 RepID=UPI00165136DD|nr:LacI family DNA-binding transcriptional regulator [Olivibacter sp. SDN3]QNL49268.1 LacI family DNA-binding transcriptional regulator [Olivibacter sp. SDN3]